MTDYFNLKDRTQNTRPLKKILGHTYATSEAEWLITTAEKDVTAKDTASKVIFANTTLLN